MFKFNKNYENVKNIVLNNISNLHKFKLEFSLSVQEMASTLTKFLLNFEANKIIVFLSTVKEVTLFCEAF